MPCVSLYPRERHYYVKCFSIESLYGASLPAFLKQLLGNKFRIAFIDVPEDIRIHRASKELGLSVDKTVDMVRKKDAQRVSFGADEVRGIADVVIDNSRETTVRDVSSILSLCNG